MQTLDTIPWYVVFGRQFLNGLILILVVAAAIALAIGEVTDAITILAIVVAEVGNAWLARRREPAVEPAPHVGRVAEGGASSDGDAVVARRHAEK